MARATSGKRRVLPIQARSQSEADKSELSTHFFAYERESVIWAWFHGESQMWILSILNSVILVTFNTI